MAFLDNTGLATQISTIKTYVQLQINTATSVLNDSIAATVPVGTIQAFAGSVMPEGWLLCDGSAISRTTYAALFNTIGNTYGSGNGETTFNLPNLIDKFIEGGNTAGVVKTAGLPNITGTAYLTTSAGGWNTVVSATGAMSTQTEFIYNDGVAGGKDIQLGDTSQYRSPINFSASNSNSIYGNSTTVQPPALVLKYIIKY